LKLFDWLARITRDERREPSGDHEERGFIMNIMHEHATIAEQDLIRMLSRLCPVSIRITPHLQHDGSSVYAWQGKPAEPILSCWGPSKPLWKRPCSLSPLLHRQKRQAGLRLIFPSPLDRPEHKTAWGHLPLEGMPGGEGPCANTGNLPPCPGTRSGFSALERSRQTGSSQHKRRSCTRPLG
jgi:hypothetical protein